MSFTRAIPRATSTLARTQSVLVQNQARSLSLTAARKSADHGDHYDPPSGWLFGVKPGEKAEKEGWEGLWVYGFFGACAFGVVGYAVKPDTSYVLLLSFVEFLDLRERWKMRIWVEGLEGAVWDGGSKIEGLRGKK